MQVIMKLYEELEMYQGRSQAHPDAIEAKNKCEQLIGDLRQRVWVTFLEKDPDALARNQFVDAPEVFQHLLMLIGIDCDLIGLWSGASIMVGTAGTASEQPNLKGLTTHKLKVSLIFGENHWRCIERTNSGYVCHDDAWSSLEKPYGVWYMPIYTGVEPTGETWPCPDPICGFSNFLAMDTCKSCKSTKIVAQRRAEERALEQSIDESNVAEFQRQQEELEAITREQEEKEALKRAIEMSMFPDAAANESAPAANESAPAANESAPAADESAAADWSDDEEGDNNWSDVVEVD